MCTVPSRHSRCVTRRSKTLPLRLDKEREHMICHHVVPEQWTLNAENVDSFQIFWNMQEGVILRGSGRKIELVSWLVLLPRDRNSRIGTGMVFLELPVFSLGCPNAKEGHHCPWPLKLLISFELQGTTFNGKFFTEVQNRVQVDYYCLTSKTRVAGRYADVFFTQILF